MERKHIIFVKDYFPLDEDPRVLKEVTVLKETNYITFLCWNKLCQGSSKKELHKDNKVIALELGVPLNNFVSFNPIFNYFLLPIWWIFILKWLLKEKWDIVHVINFQSILPSIVAGKLKGKPIIYEIEDTWFDQMSLPLFVRLIFLWIDKFLMRSSTAVILVDELQEIEFWGIPNRNITVIYDSAIEINKPIKKDLEQKVFTLFYAGEITKHRRLNLDKLVEAIKEIDEVRVIFAGGGQIDQIKNWAKIMPHKVEFLGRIPYHEALEMCLNSDLLFVLRDSILPIHKYICGSKIFEAMMCGKPILVSKGTSTAIKVSKEKMGVIVDPNNVEEIKAAIISLKENHTLYNILGKNSRAAYDNKYGWPIMGKRLIDLYHKVTS